MKHPKNYCAYCRKRQEVEKGEEYDTCKVCKRRIKKLNFGGIFG